MCCRMKWVTNIDMFGSRRAKFKSYTSAEYRKEEELTDGMNRHEVSGVLNEFPFKETMSSSLHAWLSETGGGLHPSICFTQGTIYRHNSLVVNYLVF